MEAESKLERSSRRHDEGWAKSRTYTNNIKTQDFLSKYFNPKSMTHNQMAAGPTTTSTTLRNVDTIPKYRKGDYKQVTCVLKL